MSTLVTEKSVAEDKALDHLEPEFIEVPIQQLLPEKWHSDYVRACGGGERGEQTPSCSQRTVCKSHSWIFLIFFVFCPGCSCL